MKNKKKTENKNESLLTKAAHLIEEKPAEEAKEEKPAEEVKEPVPQSRNKALIFYITLLFSAAFVLVLVSLLVTIVQQKNSSDTIHQLNENASSALSHAEQLQNDNRLLLEERDELRDTLDQLSEENEDLEKRLSKAQQQIASLEEAEEAQTQEKEKQLEAYEKLLAAQSCLDQELIPDFEEAMAELAEMTDYLSERGLSLYEELAAQLNVE